MLIPPLTKEEIEAEISADRSERRCTAPDLMICGWWQKLRCEDIVFYRQEMRNVMNTAEAIAQALSLKASDCYLLLVMLLASLGKPDPGIDRVLQGEASLAS
jgi:hypothetical protein